MPCAEPLTLLYRGPLESCNYGCAYCPFDERGSTPDELAADRGALERFVDWVSAAERPLRLFFTPRGEALIHPWYQEALRRLSRLRHLERATIQTNLSAPLGWLEGAEPSRLGVWATYHPARSSRERFLESCAALERRGVMFSVGVVGLREHLHEIEALRATLSPRIYVWVNAFKHEPGYYRPDELARIEAVDPQFPVELDPGSSLGQPCRTGCSALSVGGAGDASRCFFVDDPRGNLYRGDLALDPAPTPCPASTCRCYIGYVFREQLPLTRSRY